MSIQDKTNQRYVCREVPGTNGYGFNVYDRVREQFIARVGSGSSYDIKELAKKMNKTWNAVKKENA